MVKGSALIFWSAVVVASPALVAACSGSDTSTFDDDEQKDAAPDSPGTFNTDAGGESDGGAADGAAPKCEPIIEDNYLPKWMPPTKPSKPAPCSSPDIDDYYTECLETLGKPDHDSRCKAWTAAHATCTSCVEPTDNTGPIQWRQSRFYYTLNIAGCIAIEQDKYAATDCGGAYGQAVDCGRDACDGCFKTGTSTFDDFRNCQREAQTVGICKSLEAQQASVCDNVATTTPTDVCFNKDGKEDTKVFYTRVMNVFCVP